jgi:hypothetical protein
MISVSGSISMILKSCDGDEDIVSIEIISEPQMIKLNYLNLYLYLQDIIRNILTQERNLFQDAKIGLRSLTR